MGFSWNSGARSWLMERILQLSSMAFFRFGKFLLYVTARIFFPVGMASLGFSKSVRLLSRALEICSAIRSGAYPRSTSFLDNFLLWCSNSEISEQIRLIRRAWLYAMLRLQELGWYDLLCR